MPEIANTAVFSQTDANNNSGTMPSWLGSAAPSTIDDAGRAFQGAVTREWNWRNFTLTAGGTADAKTLTYGVAPAAYYTGQIYSFIANTTNTATCTINVNSLGAKTIKSDVSGTMTALASGDMISGMRVMLAYDGTDMIWVNQKTTLSSVAYTNVANTFTADQTITSTDAGAAIAPTLSLNRNSASPAADDSIGAVNFTGEDSAGNTETYGSVFGRIVDPTSTSEDGEVRIQTVVAGTLTSRLRVGAGTYTANATSGDMGVDTINASEYYKNGVRATRHLISTLTTTSGTTHSVTSIPAYRELYIEIAGVSFDANATMTLAVSDDNGSNYGTARNISVASGGANGVIYGIIRISGIQATDMFPVAHSVTALAPTASATDLNVCMAEAGAGMAVINAIQFAGGTFDAGAIRVYGLL